MEDASKNNKNAAFEQAVKRLSYRDLTEAEMRKYLNEKGYSEEARNEAVDLLLEYHYLDDAHFAARYFRYGIEKGKGLRRIRAELRNRQARPDAIEEGWDAYIEEYGEPDEEAMAEKEALAVLRSAGFDDWEDHPDGIPDKVLARVARRLATKGYRQTVVYRILDRLR